MRTVQYTCLLLCLALYLSNSECARILAIFAMPTRSHCILGNRLLAELARRGHEVTMVSAFSQETHLKNFKNILLNGVMENRKEMLLSNENLFQCRKVSVFFKFRYVSNLGITNVIDTLENPKFKKLMESKEKFDLIIIDLIQVEALLALGPYYNCPIIGIDTIGVPYFTNYIVGNPASFAYTPQAYSLYSTDMTLYERFSNALNGLLIEAYRKYIHLPKHDSIVRKYFKDYPSLEEIIYNNVSMILVNSHPSISGALPHVPAMVEIGSFHVPDPKPLPQELQEYLDDATDGAILFSMGSIISSAGMPEDKKNAIFTSFGKLKQKVIWKYDNENSTTRLNNVKFVRWLPQNDILAHPNLKVFVTHGGILGLTEAIYHGVPILGISVFGDQHMNINIAEKKGYGLSMNLFDLTEESFTAALNKIINNTQYSENAKMRSKQLRDQPIKPMDAAVYWTEYVIRHKGAKHLRSPAMDLHWTQIYLLDVISLLIFSTVALLFSVSMIIKRIALYKKIIMKDKIQ